MKITFACVFRNEEILLKDLLDQVVKLKPFEAIFVDDFSTDKSMELLESYKNKIKNLKIFQHEMEGFGQQRNFLLDNAEGDFVLWADSDDLYYPLKDLKILLDSLDLSNCKLCYAFRRPSVIDDMFHIGTDPDKLIAIGGLVRNLPEIRFSLGSHPGPIYAKDPEKRVFHWIGTPEYVIYVPQIIILHRHYLLDNKILDEKSKGNDRFLESSKAQGVLSFHGVHLYQKQVAKLNKQPRTNIQGVDWSQPE